MPQDSSKEEKDGVRNKKKRKGKKQKKEIKETIEIIVKCLLVALFFEMIYYIISYGLIYSLPIWLCISVLSAPFLFVQAGIPGMIITLIQFGLIILKLS